MTQIRERDDVDLTIRITKKQYAMLAEAAKLHGKSTQALVRNMIKIVGESACLTQRENVNQDGDFI